MKHFCGFVATLAPSARHAITILSKSEVEFEASDYNEAQKIAEEEFRKMGVTLADNERVSVVCDD
jgi:hypothetical protein